MIIQLLLAQQQIDSSVSKPFFTAHDWKMIFFGLVVLVILYLIWLGNRKGPTQRG